MANFREQLDKVNELNLDLCDIEIANEIDCVVDYNLDAEQFENLCYFTKEIYLKSDFLSINDIARCIDDLLNIDSMSFENIVSMDYYEFMDRAYRYAQ